MYQLPPQQILQSNGNLESLRMSPNSSVLIADSMNPIVYKCVSDSLGNITTEAFDITPHKSEAEVEKENLLSTLTQINNRLQKLEADYESITSRNQYKQNPAK